jgi:phosphoglycolate phosphatase-like HAD superfamily hydrolase
VGLRPVMLARLANLVLIYQDKSRFDALEGQLNELGRMFFGLGKEHLVDLDGYLADHNPAGLTLTDRAYEHADEMVYDFEVACYQAGLALSRGNFDKAREALERRIPVDNKLAYIVDDYRPALLISMKSQVGNADMTEDMRVYLGALIDSSYRALEQERGDRETSPTVLAMYRGTFDQPFMDWYLQAFPEVRYMIETFIG